LNKTIGTILKVILFFSIGFGILYLVYRNQSAAWLEQCALDNKTPEECGTLIEKVVNDFKSANYFWILMVLVAYTISNISRAIRWQMLIEPLSHKPRVINTFLASMAMYFANLGVPRSGEVIRAASISQYEKIKVEKVFGTVFTERVVDVISLAIVIGLSLIFEFDKLWNFIITSLEEKGKDGNILSNPWVLSFLGVSVASVLLLFVFRKKIMQTSLYAKLVDIVKGFIEGIQSVAKLERPGWFIFHSVNIWIMYFLMTYLAFFAFAPTAHLGLVAGLLTFVFGALAIVVPAPGGLGTYHYLVPLCLASLYGISDADGFSFANIIFFSINIGCNVLLGLIAFITLPIINKNYEPQISTDQ